MRSSDSEQDNEFEVLISQSDIKELHKRNKILQQQLEKLQISSEQKESMLLEKLTLAETSYRNYKEQSLKIQMECLRCIRQIFELKLDEKQNKYLMVDESHIVNKPDQFSQKMDAVQQQNKELKERIKIFEEKIAQIEGMGSNIINKYSKNIVQIHNNGKKQQNTHTSDKFEEQIQFLKGQLRGKEEKIKELEKKVWENEEESKKYIKNLEKDLQACENKLKDMKKISGNNINQQKAQYDKDSIINQMREQLKTEFASKSKIMKQLQSVKKENQQLLLQLNEKMKNKTKVTNLTFEKVLSIIEEYILEQCIKNIQSQDIKLSEVLIESLIQQMRKLIIN